MARPASGVREKILDAAVDLLREQGARSLTQPQVARAAGVLQSHLTYYFPRRTDLLLAVARHSTERTTRELHGFVAAQPFAAADGAVQARVLDLARRLAKDRGRTRILLALLVEADDDPQLAEVIAEGVAGVRAVVALALGRPLDDLDVDLVLAAFWGIGLQHFIQGRQRGDAHTDALFARIPAWAERAPSRSK